MKVKLKRSLNSFFHKVFDESTLPSDSLGQADFRESIKERIRPLGIRPSSLVERYIAVVNSKIAGRVYKKDPG